MEMIIKYMLTGFIDGPKTAGNEQISDLLKFFIVADYIGLLGSITGILGNMRRLLRNDKRVSILSEHISIATHLPSSHPAIEWIADGCVVDYARSLFFQSTFKFEKEIMEEDGFAADLLKASYKAKMKQSVAGPSFENLVFDPISKTLVKI